VRVAGDRYGKSRTRQLMLLSTRRAGMICCRLSLARNTFPFAYYSDSGN
jgi:hypothetical protein